MAALSRLELLPSQVALGIIWKHLDDEAAAHLALCSRRLLRAAGLAALAKFPRHCNPALNSIPDWGSTCSHSEECLYKFRLRCRVWRALELVVEGLDARRVICWSCAAIHDAIASAHDEGPCVYTVVFWLIPPLSPAFVPRYLDT